MTPPVETLTPPGTPTPIGPYNHIAKVGQWITIGGTAAFDPVTGELAEPDVAARTVIGVNALPKPGVRLTMNLTAVTKP